MLSAFLVNLPMLFWSSASSTGRRVRRFQAAKRRFAPGCEMSKKGEEKISHRHYCEEGGHYWQCDGVAVRGANAEAKVCMCFDHHVPMEQGDHNGCTIELLACPDCDTSTKFARGSIKVPRHEFPGVARRDSRRHCVGVCLWCGHGYTKFNLKIQARHLKSCVEYQRAKLSLDDTPNS